MANTSNFDTAYQRLNDQQKRAVDTIEGPVMVLAGPGTGKTQTLSLRIANIIRQTDVQPQNILALTFTNTAAKNLQQRLMDFIGPAAYGVKCTTFHSFCAGVIEEHAEFFPVLPSLQEPVSALEQLGLMEQIFDQNDFLHLKNVKNPYYYVRDAVSSIAQYKREGHSPLTIRQLAQDELAALEQSDLPPYKQRQQALQIEKNIDLAQVYSEYQRLMAEHQWYDFEDLILWVRDALRDNEDLRLTYQERYQYFLIDEYQDTNEGQLQVVHELAAFWGEAANIFVVGDPNQSIYRFQGASLANTLSFLDHYPQAQVIQLTTGYRCGQQIYDAAAKLIAHNPQEVKDERLADLYQPLHHWQDKTGKLRLQPASTPLSEAMWIVQQIEKQHQAGVAWADMAVLYRKNRNSTLLEELLTHAEIPYQVNQQTNILENQLVQQVLVLLNFLVGIRGKQEASLVLPLLQLPWFHLNAQDVLTLIRAATHSPTYSGNPWLLWNDSAGLERLELRQRQQLVALRDQLIELQNQEQTLALSEFVETILRETGFYAWTQEEAVGTSDLVAVASFLRHLQIWAKRDPTRRLSGFLHDIERMQQHGLTLSQEPLQMQSNAVTLATAHQAKGQEWGQVFIMQAQDQVWGNLRNIDKIKPLPGMIPYADLSGDERNEDERRLFYVALTRAKDAVHISFSEKDVKGDRKRELQPSQFLAEMPANLFEVTQPLSVDDVGQQLRQHFQASAQVHPAKQLDEAWLHSLVDNFSFSFTALQEFEACPLSFFYRRLIRIPEPSQRALAMGTMVHAALEALYRQFNQSNEIPPLSQLHEVIEKSMRRFDFSVDEALGLEAQAKSIVTSYVEAHENEIKPSLLVERFFGGQPPIQFEGLPLVGKVDRIDLIDSVSKEVCVVDYKTGNVHSRNDILGKTASSDGGMIKQLVFYRLLGDLDPSFTHRIREGKFIFVEKNDSGKYKAEQFSITDEQVEELKQELREVKKKFYSLEFLDEPPCRECPACKMFGFKPSELHRQLANSDSE
jgi:DNA helicase-2/ATP-dependent DNA helicase PcrA